MASARLTSSIRAAWRAHGEDALAVVLLAALTLFSRWFTLEPIENGGDPLDNWYFVRQWAHDFDFRHATIDHHASRFGIHWITFVVQKLFGIHPQYYYFPQLFAAVVCSVLTYLLGRRSGGKAVGVLATLFLIESNSFISASSQLRPAIFECMYALAAANCLIQFLLKTGRSAIYWLGACALFTFLGYLAHEPALFIAPGISLVVWLARRSARDFLIYWGVLAALFLLESAGYALFTQYWHRIQVLGSSHLTRPGPGRDFWYLLERFSGASDSVKLAYYPFFAAGPAILVFGKHLKEKAVVIVAASFLLLATFLVRSIDPLIVFMQNNDRYIFATMPFAYVATAWVLVAAGRAAVVRSWVLLGERLGERLVAFPLPLRAWMARAALWAGALALMTAAALKAQYEDARKWHPWGGIDAIYETLNDTYARKLPIIAEVSKRRGPAFQTRGLHWAQKGFIKDELLLKDGRLPPFSYANSVGILNSNRRYIPVVPELDAERVQDLVKDDCALELKINGTFMRLSRTTPLPEHCRP